MSSHPIDCISAMRSQEKWVRSREVNASCGNFSTAAIVILLEHFYAKQHHHCSVGTHPQMPSPAADKEENYSIVDGTGIHRPSLRPDQAQTRMGSSSCLHHIHHTLDNRHTDSLDPASKDPALSERGRPENRAGTPQAGGSIDHGPGPTTGPEVRRLPSPSNPCDS